jgi:hypothetical protein
MTPSYFDPTAQPDTETEYRRGGKVNKMQKFSVAKKMPRKFGEGGKTTAPAVKPAKSGPPELVKEAEAAKTDANQNAAMNKFYDDKNRLNPVKKAKGGSVKKVRKFADGGETTAEDKDVSYEMPSEPKVSGSRFGADTYERATRQLSGADKKASASTYKASPKKVSTVKVGAKPAPAKPAPAKSSDYDKEPKAAEAPKRAGATGSYDKEPKAAENKQASDSDMDVTSRLKKAFSNIDLGYLTRPNKALYAKGGGVEAKGKTQSKVVKMAKGGMARGYGISKVTNKTKYC